jgi:RES domain-containing protein
MTPASFSAPAFCTGPVSPTLDVAELTSTDANRWSREGEPTIYLAGDPGVALAELGRHWGEQRGEIAVWSLDLTLEAAADLRDPATWATLGVPDDPTWILDKDRCRALASRLRSDGAHDGLIVPSAAFLDDVSRWNAVVFVDRQPGPLDDVIRVDSAAMRLTPTSGS